VNPQVFGLHVFSRRSRDADFAILADAANLARLTKALDENRSWQPTPERPMIF
jgi:hypothetical protein